MPLHNPPHPGGFIRRNYLEELDLSINEVARALKVSPSTFGRLVNEQSNISPDMALRLSQVLGGSPECWLGMQRSWDLFQARQTYQGQELQCLIPT